MRTSLIILFLMIGIGTFAQTEKNFFSFSAVTIDGDTIQLSKYKGQRVLVVNTASKCGYTPQYEQLQELYNQYGGKGFEIIGFPANDFLKQEPGSNDEIADFCKKNYGVTFQMMEKISVKGKDIHPLYKWLTEKSENGVIDAPVKWNFQKFLIDENGNLIKSIPTKVNPLDDEIVSFAKGK